MCEENRIEVESVCNVVLVRGKKDPKSFQVINWILQSFFAILHLGLLGQSCTVLVGMSVCIVLSAKCKVQSDP